MASSMKAAISPSESPAARAASRQRPGDPDIPFLPRQAKHQRFRPRAVDQRALLLLDRQLPFLRRIDRQRRAGLDVRRRVTGAAGKPIPTK